MTELCPEYAERLLVLINVITSYYIYLDAQEGVRLQRLDAAHQHHPPLPGSRLAAH